MMDTLQSYWLMVKEWEAVLAQPLSDEAKQAACLALLRTYVDRMARARVGQPNPALRFYADMLMLRSYIQPSFTKGNDLERLVLYPLSDLVRNWVSKHTEPTSVRPACSATPTQS